MADDRYELTKHDGKTVDRYTDYNLYLAEERLGYPLTIVQGSYHPGVGASAGTHDGGGVVDLAPWDWQRKVRVLRELGFAAWHRPYRKGVWPEHIHAVLLGNEKASPLAKQQMDAYRRGRDGLASNGYDTFWRPNPIKPAAYKEASVDVYPASILGKHFQKVTLPIDGPDAGSYADELTGDRLATYSSRWLRVASDGTSVLFTTPHGGATTKGSKNPRCEARETNTDGSLAKWDGRHGSHRLEVVESVNRLTIVRPHVVVAQIHNADDDVTVLRLEGVKGTPRMKAWLTDSDNTHAHLLGELSLTQRFTFAFDIADGEVRFDFNGKRQNFTVGATANSYFKVGNYLQSNRETAPAESTSSSAEVRLFATPKVRHA